MRACKDMPYHAGIVLRIYPDDRQRKIIAVNGGCSRFVYNRLVALNNERYQLAKYASLVPAYRDRIAYIDSILHNPAANMKAALKNSAPFLDGELVDSLTVDNAIKNYNSAWEKFREDPHAGVPSFHRKGYDISYQTNAHYHAGMWNINDGNIRFTDNGHIKLPIIGRIRIRGSIKRIRDLNGRILTRIGTVRICCDAAGRYFASLQLASEYPFSRELAGTGSCVGIDLNVDNFLWDSNGDVVENRKYKRAVRKKIARRQRRCSRKAVRAKKEGRPLRSCKNYQKDRKRLALMHAQTAARGEDFRHVISKRYVKNHDFIFAEDLKVRNLLKNHRLAFAISECGWSDFLSKLEYKAQLYGKTFIKVPPAGTTQTCSSCGHVMCGDGKLALGDREWVCPACGTYHLRDHNAAQVILARGMASLGLQHAPWFGSSPG